MAGNTSNVKVGDVEFYIDYNDGAGEIHLGHTKGGVEFTIEREFFEKMVDQYGNTPIDKILTGNRLKVKAFLAETDTDTMRHALPEGAFATNAGDSKLGIGRDAGYSMGDNVAVTVRMHPRQNGPAERNDDIYLHKAVSFESIELPFKIDEQRVLETTFEALVDETQPDGERLGRVGDPDIS